MAILTSDHFIANEDGFRQLLRTAEQVARDGYLVTLGIEPGYPATGYGYIQQGDSLGRYGGLEVYNAIRFKEKPSEDQARQMLASHDHAWNSGMFVWQVDRILDEFHRQMPALSSALEEISGAWGTPAQGQVLQTIWPQLKSETIDYGIMEGAQRVAVIPAAGLGWNDVGSWDSLFDVLDADEHGNIVIGGKHVGLETSRSLVYVNQEHRLIVTIGVEDLVVVDTGDVLLVCHKDQAQKVRNVVDQLKKTGETYI
jgi:mannose-1-phosphate guanylyltransferase